MADRNIINGQIRIIKMPALGRRFQLGDVYDYRSDRIIQRAGQFGWESAIEVHDYFKLKFRHNDTSSSKCQHMRLDEHLQASVAAGLIDNFIGASSYLTDIADATKSSRTVVCRTKTRKECLNLQQIANNNTDDSEDNLTKLESTHVVVGVSYGAEAYCVISQDLLSGKEEKLSTFVRQFEIAIEENRNYTEFKSQFDQLDKLWIARLNCRLYADLQAQPDRECGVIDIYNYCLKLVQQMRKSGNSSAIPITVRLCPLNVFTGKIANKIMTYRDVAAGLVARICRLWNELEKLEDKENCVDVPSNSIRDQMTQFFTALVKYKRNLRAKLKEEIQSARSSNSDDDLETFVNFAENHSLFKLSLLQRWIFYKEKEAEIVQQMTNVTGAVFLECKSQLKKKETSLVLCLPPIGEWADKMLEAMKKYAEDDKPESVDEDGPPWHLVQHKKQVVFAKIRELADHVNNNRHLSTNRVEFYIAFEQTNFVCKGIRCSYSVYEGDTLVKANLDRLPGRPIHLRVDAMKDAKAIHVEWGYDDLGLLCHFWVQFRLKGQSDESWVERRTTKPDETETTISVMGNQPAMEIRVAADTCIGRSQFSDVVVTDECHWPVADPNKESTVITIIPQQFPISVEVEGSRNVDCNKEHVMPTVIVMNDVKSSECTNQRIADIFATESDKSQLIRPGKPNVYQLNATDNSVSSDLRWFQTGRPNHGDRNHKVIILMGATGSGKSTLINGMVNYILGVEWDDPYRFKCVREDDCVTRNQAHSQTSSVTAYTIHHQKGMAVPYSITLIDTPGYGDTRGISRDKEITDLIHRFLMGKDAQIDHIHAACFVAASGDSRLTVTQRYILNSVLSIFGKDFKENIRLLVTFADNATPPVVEACRVANFPVTSQSAGISYSKFNSSVLYSENTQDDFNFDQLFWDMGQENFAKFFTMLEGMDGKDLKSTREVIQHRRVLQHSLAQTESELEEYFMQIESLRRRMYGCGPVTSTNENELNRLKANMLSLLNGVADSIRSLESTALRWSGFSLSDYLSLMMSRVAEEQKPGYEIRLETLAELQELIQTPEIHLGTIDELPKRTCITKRWRYWIVCLITYVFPFAFLVCLLELLRHEKII